MDEQPQAGSDPIDRLSAFFGGPKEEPPKPVEQEAPETQEIEAAEDAPEGETDDGSEDYDVDGQSYRLPKDLKAKVDEWRNGHLRQEDYTRKTQEVAAMHRQVATIAEAARMRQEFESSVSDEMAEIAGINRQLAQFKSLDWNGLDSDLMLKLSFQRDQLRERARELDETVQKKGRDLQQKMNQKQRELEENGRRYLSQTIKGWGKDTEAEVVKAAQEVGYTQEELKSVFDVRFVRLAHKAAQYDRLLASKAQASEKATKAPPVVKPGVGSGQRAASEQRYKDARGALKKSGDVRDAARLLMMRG